MVSPLVATAIAARSEPGPLSLVLVTVTVLSKVRSSMRSTRGRNGLRRVHPPLGLHDQDRDPSGFVFDSFADGDMGRVSGFQ